MNKMTVIVNCSEERIIQVFVELCCSGISVI